MKINKNSWHYRFLTGSCSTTAPKTLCGYFWSIVWCCLVLSIGVGIAGMFLWMVSSPIWNLYFNIKEYDSLVRAVSYLWSGGLLITAFCYLKDKSSFIRVFIEYLKAVKNKMCPLIEYVGDDDERKTS